ncbi:MAG: D-alanine--D-alanine ligase family protein [Bacteroidota bacterium]
MASTPIILLFGGSSPEHEISIRSARNIYEAMDRNTYAIQLVGIAKNGQWYALPDDFLPAGKSDIAAEGQPICLVPGSQEAPIRYLDGKPFPRPEAVFCINHGPFGEDGSLQGILRHLGLPFVGPDVLGSAVAMDKDVCKRLLREADLKVAEGLTFRYYEKDAIDYAAVRNRLGSPLFIKPANMGSSVGVSKAENKAEFDAAVAEAFRYDHKIIVEEAIVGRELECAVLGNGQVATTSIGEVAMTQATDAELYDYASKYLSDTAADILIPAPDLDNQTLAKLMLVAKNAYLALECEGMSRVDMFLTEDGAVYVNEVNTLPGFTSISMYPKLWEQAGTPYNELIDELIKLAIERGKRTAKLEKSL